MNGVRMKRMEVYYIVILSEAKNLITLFVHFFFLISMQKEKVEPKKKNTNDQIVRVIRGFAPEPLYRVMRYFG